MRVALALLLAASLPLAGCLRDFEQPGPANHLRLQGIDVSAPMVTSGTVTLAVNVTLDNLFDDSGPVRLVVKAFDANTGFRVQTNTTGTFELEADKTVPVEVRLTVDRASGYRIEVDVYHDGQLTQHGQVTVRNIQALEPTLHETGLAIGTLDFIVRNVTGNRVAIETHVYLTNEGATTSRPLEMQVKARDLATGLLADEARTPVPALPPEETHPQTVRLDVPDGHNYVVEVVLWDGNLTVERGKGTVQLLPTITKDKDEEIVVSDPRIEDFVRGGRDTAAEAGDGRGGFRGVHDEAAETPGLGVLLAVATVAAAALLTTRRWSR